MLNALLFNLIILYIWFETDAFVNYARLFGIKFLKYQEYINFKEKSFSLSYPTYIALKHDNFLSQLLVCPVCLSVWLNIILYYFFKLDLTGIFENIILSWIFYPILVKVLKYLNE